MKEKDAQVDFESHKMTLFVEKEDGSYGTIQTGSYLAKNYLDEFWANMKHFKKTAVTQLINNEISPIAYYLITKEMAPADVAARIGISASQVKKQMTPKHFGTMKLSVVQQYADVFGIPVANLFQIATDDENADLIQQKNTKNPFVTTLESKEG
jgi:hypothetical protein